jgi:hypothetical protein
LKNCGTPDDVLIALQKRIAKKYNNFASASNYSDFFAAFNSKYGDVITSAPCCIKLASITLQATYVLQQVFPYCIAFLNGNHRHARWAFQLFNCDRQVCHSHLKDIDILKDDVNDGYIIKTAGNSDDDKDWTCHLHYQFYSIKEAHKSSELTLHQLQSISERCNLVLKKSLEEEACHR